MKMKEIVDKVSDLYRGQCGERFDLQQRRIEIHKTLNEAYLTKYENITVAEYNSLQTELKHLDKQIDMKDQFCEGISCVRELLMDLGFDTEVK